MARPSSAYNPWEDRQSFIQDSATVDDFISFVNAHSLSNSNDSGYDVLALTKIKEYNDANTTVDLLNELNEVSVKQYECLKKLEVMYEKYKYEWLLSSDKNSEMITKVNEIQMMFDVFERNKIKVVNLLHNCGLNDEGVVKIKHAKKMEFIKGVKIWTSNYSHVLDLVELNEGIHVNTIKQLGEKIKEYEKLTEEIVNEYNRVKQIKNE